MQPLYAKHGIQLVLVEKYGGKDTDMRTQITKLKEADIDTWFACGAYQDTGLVFKQAKELGFTKPAFGMVAVESKKLFEVAGDAAEGVIFTSTKWSCDNAQSFCDTFKQKYNATPDYRAAFGYDAPKIIAEAIKRNGYSAEGIQKGLLSIQDFVGAGGKTAFDAEGNAQKEVIVKQVKGDKFVVLE
jgi:branched-chain amino acid transport system substrate-binding protein